MIWLYFLLSAAICGWMMYYFIQQFESYKVTNEGACKDLETRVAKLIGEEKQDLHQEIEKLKKDYSRFRTNVLGSLEEEKCFILHKFEELEGLPKKASRPQTSPRKKAKASPRQKA